MLNALKSNLKTADDVKKLSLPGGYTAPADTERALKKAALKCAEKYFDGKEKQGLPMLAATMAEFSISPRAKNANTTTSEMPRGRVARS